jgi:nucleoside-diphosphate-sugar epimerase
LLAGGAGYVGSALAPVLLEHGYEVEVVDLLWFGNHLPANVKVTRKNLFDCCAKEFEGFDQMIFLAGLSNDPMAEFDPASNFIYNAALPSYLAFEAKKAGVRRFIYASSCSIYGYTVNQLYDENSPATCSYPYGISKLQGEQGVMKMMDSTFSTISLRQGTICGHSPRMRFDLVINTMFKTALTGDLISVNNPSLWRPIFHIQDAVTAYMRAVQADYSLGGVFNVSSDNYTIGQAGDLVKYELERLTGKRVRIVLKDVKDFRNYKVSIHKARTELGFQPKRSIEDIVADLHAHRASYGDYENDNYYNIRVFKNLLVAQGAVQDALHKDGPRVSRANP